LIVLTSTIVDALGLLLVLQIFCKRFDASRNCELS